MTEEIMALCRAMGATEDQEGLLLPLAQASAQALERRLKPGTSPGLCGPAFPPGCRHAGDGWAGAGRGKRPSVLLHRRRIVHPYGGNGRRGRPDRYGGTAAGPLAGRDRLCLSGGAGMMEREWRSLLAMYGQEVTLRLEGMEDRPLRAFLQPVLDREREQRLPSPLGQRPEDGIYI